jgi:hypothetical protein
VNGEGAIVKIDLLGLGFNLQDQSSHARPQSARVGVLERV